MKKIILSILFCQLLCLTTWAQVVYTPENLLKVHLVDKTRYVCDPENILNVAARDSIDRMLYALEQQTGIQTVVAVVPTIGEADCFDFCHQLLNTGYGLEGPLPDAICKRIQTRHMIPYLKENRWSEGMVAGIRATCARLDGSMENDLPADGDDDGAGSVFLVLFGIVAVGVFLAVIAMHAASKCPKCGQHKLQRSSSRLIALRNGVRTEDVTYTCRNCGHQVIRRQQSYDDNYRGRRGSGGGPFIFGSGGGGGFSGGSFGGGMGGGGGAGSRF